MGIGEIGLLYISKFERVKFNCAIISSSVNKTNNQWSTTSYLQITIQNWLKKAALLNILFCNIINKQLWRRAISIIITQPKFVYFWDRHWQEYGLIFYSLITASPKYVIFKSSLSKYTMKKQAHLYWCMIIFMLPL